MKAPYVVNILAAIVLLGVGCRPDDVYTAAGLDAGEWLRAQALPKADGTAWASDPTDSSTIATNLYSGSAGVVLYFLEAYRITGDGRYLDDARAGADYLIAGLPDSLGNQSGLYTGVAGLGFVLEETHQATGDQRYRDAAQQATDLLIDGAEPTNAGVTWTGVTDIVSGAAGTGLYLIYAANRLEREDALETAIQAGHELISQRIIAPGGSKWAMHAQFPRLMPNFSHGTAGVAYFLADLYLETGDPVFLNAAKEGAEYLLRATNNDGLIFHHEPEGEDLFYLSWCHGPPGTARLYYRLWQLTGERRWIDKVHQAAEGVMHTGIPDALTDGFWNNVGQCCGSAGVAEFFHGLYLATDEPAYHEFAQHVTDNLVDRATATAHGRSWIQAEHRVQPDLLIAQTGYMQGAAGIGMWLLHAGENDAADRITLPDSPW